MISALGKPWKRKLPFSPATLMSRWNLCGQGESRSITAKSGKHSLLGVPAEKPVYSMACQARAKQRDTHSLLAHGRLVGVTWRLVVVGEGDDGSTDAQNHGGVNLAVRVGLDGGVLVLRPPSADP